MTKPEHLLAAVAQKLRELLGPSPDWHSATKFLRFEGDCSKTESIFILSRYFHLAYPEALHIVHNSPHWIDRKELDEELQEEFCTSISQSGMRYFLEERESGWAVIDSQTGEPALAGTVALDSAATAEEFFDSLDLLNAIALARRAPH